MLQKNGPQKRLMSDHPPETIYTATQQEPMTITMENNNKMKKWTPHVNGELENKLPTTNQRPEHKRNWGMILRFPSLLRKPEHNSTFKCEW